MRSLFRVMYGRWKLCCKGAAEHSLDNYRLHVKDGRKYPLLIFLIGCNRVNNDSKNGSVICIYEALCVMCCVGLIDFLRLLLPYSFWSVAYDN